MCVSFGYVLGNCVHQFLFPSLLVKLYAFLLSASTAETLLSTRALLNDLCCPETAIISVGVCWSCSVLASRDHFSNRMTVYELKRWINGNIAALLHLLSDRSRCGCICLKEKGSRSIVVLSHDSFLWTNGKQHTTVVSTALGDVDIPFIVTAPVSSSRIF